MKIYFVRHGQTEWNVLGKFQGHNNSNLTEEGVTQANKLGEALRSKGKEFHKVYSSPLGRASDTAKIITKREDIHHVDEFREISVGDMEGVVFTEFEKLFPEEFHAFFKEPLKYDPSKINGETFQSLLDRVEKGLAFITENSEEEEEILVVTHGITLKAIFNILKNGKGEISNFADIAVPGNTSITEVHYHKGNKSFTIVDFSNTDHLK